MENNDNNENEMVPVEAQLLEQVPREAEAAAVENRPAEGPVQEVHRLALPPNVNDNPDPALILNQVQTWLAEVKRRKKRGEELKKNNPHFHDYQIFLVSQASTDDLDEARLMQMYLTLNQNLEALDQEQQRSLDRWSGNGRLG